MDTSSINPEAADEDINGYSRARYKECKQFYENIFERYEKLQQLVGEMDEDSTEVLDKDDIQGDRSDDQIEVSETEDAETKMFVEEFRRLQNMNMR